MARRSVLLVLVLFLIASMLPAPDPGAAAGTPLYPDLKTTRPSGLYFDRVTMSDGMSHYVIRFSNTVWNAGEGRLELQGDPNPSGSNKIYQNFYDAKTGGTRVLQRQVSADILYHPSHYHYHFQGFASYLLLQRDAAGVYQPTTKKGTKTSFCIMDVSRITSTGPTYGQYASCGGTLQGLSVGWGDTYESSLPEQWIDLGTSRLPDGFYAIQSTADPQNKLNEGGRDNNNVGLTYFSVSSGAISIRSAPTTASCGMSPTKGASGSSATITCSEFGARETVEVYWDTTSSVPLARTTSEKSGRAVLTFQVPQATNGHHSLIVTGVSSRRQDTVRFTVSNPTSVEIWLSTDSGNVGDYPSVYGTSFAPGEQVRLYWDSTATTPLRTVTASSTGSLARGITVPPTTAGVHTVVAVGVSSGREGRATFTVNGTQAVKLSVSPSSGSPGAYPTVYGSSFAPGEQVRIYWDSTATAPIRTLTATSTGAFSRGVTVPPATAGAHTIVAVGTSSGREGRATFTVNGTSTATSSSLTLSPTPTPTSTAMPSGTPTPTIVPTETPTPTVVPTETPTPTPTVAPTETPTPTLVPTETPTPTVVPTETSVPTTEVEPTSVPIGTVVATGTVANTGGETLACRSEPETGSVIAQLEPGSMVAITGPAQEGWYPVLCDNINGWVSAEFVLLEGEGSAPPEEVIEEPTEAVTEPIDIEIVPAVTDESTEAPIVMPTSEPEPVVTTWEQMVNVSADTSVTASGAPADPALLAVGGPDEAIAVLSFDVNGIESGTVVSATLVLTGAVSGPAGNVNVLPGVWVDENAASWSTIQNGSGVGQIDWLVEGTEIPIDVTGVVTGDGVVTFVVTGSPEGLAAVTSREGGAPAYLVLIIEDRA